MIAFNEIFSKSYTDSYESQNYCCTFLITMKCDEEIHLMIPTMIIHKGIPQFRFPLKDIVTLIATLRSGTRLSALVYHGTRSSLFSNSNFCVIYYRTYALSKAIIIILK